MVSPTQSVPEVLAVWGSDYKIAIVCRRYTIMVAQIHHLKPRHKTPPKNPTKNPTKNHYPRPYHYRVPPARYCVWGDSLPHTAGTYGTACVGLTIIACLRHAARSTRHLTAPLLATATTPTTNSRPSYPLPLTSYPLPLTSYLLPLTPYPLPLTSYPTEHTKRGGTLWHRPIYSRR